MDYSFHYQRLIERALKRMLSEDTYVEIHHILPRCLGGLDLTENLVKLTPEEHYLAHLLLVKIYPGNSKLIYAANMMLNRNNKSYGWIKRKFAAIHSKEHTGYRHTIESKKKMSKSRKGRPKSNNWREKMSELKLIELEYNGRIYNGYADLLEKTGITRHLYLKYYKCGKDPTPFLKNNTHGIISVSKNNHPRPAKGKKWYNNGIEEKYSMKKIPGWKLGRLPRGKNYVGI